LKTVVQSLKENNELPSTANTSPNIQGGQILQDRQTLIFTPEMKFHESLEVLNNFHAEKLLVNYLQDLKPYVPGIDEIITNCTKFCNQSLQKNPHGLTKEELLSVVLYTWDVRPSGGKKENNFHVYLNEMLQKRSATTLEIWKGYLYYFQKALSKIPACACGTIVYRGIPYQEKVKDNYKSGIVLHWSAYSSSTTLLQKAKEFATSAGIIIKITIFSNGGKPIHDYSGFPSEQEVLLSPNMKLFVTEELYKNPEDGYYYVVLHEVVSTFVF